MAQSLKQDYTSTGGSFTHQVVSGSCPDRIWSVSGSCLVWVRFGSGFVFSPCPVLYSVVFGSCFFVTLGSYVGSWLLYICYPRIRVSAREYSILV